MRKHDLCLEIGSHKHCPSIFCKDPLAHPEDFFSRTYSLPMPGKKRTFTGFSPHKLLFKWPSKPYQIELAQIQKEVKRLKNSCNVFIRKPERRNKLDPNKNDIKFAPRVIPTWHFAPDQWTTKQLHTNEAIGWFQVSSEFDLQFNICICTVDSLAVLFCSKKRFGNFNRQRKFPKGLSPEPVQTFPPHQVARQRPNQERSSVVMEEIRPTCWYGEYQTIPFLHRGSYATSGAGFLMQRLKIKSGALEYLKHMWRCASYSNFGLTSGISVFNTNLDHLQKGNLCTTDWWLQVVAWNPVEI